MATVIAASIAAIVAILGWFIGSYLIARREDRTKRLQLTMEHSEKQIGEFYAPLLGLLEQLDATFRVKERMIGQEPDNAETISKITYKEYFLPLHREIGEVAYASVSGSPISGGRASEYGVEQISNMSRFGRLP